MRASLGTDKQRKRQLMEGLLQKLSTESATAPTPTITSFSHDIEYDTTWPDSIPAPSSFVAARLSHPGDQRVLRYAAHLLRDEMSRFAVNNDSPAILQAGTGTHVVRKEDHTFVISHHYHLTGGRRHSWTTLWAETPALLQDFLDTASRPQRLPHQLVLYAPATHGAVEDAKGWIVHDRPVQRMLSACAASGVPASIASDALRDMRAFQQAAGRYAALGLPHRRVYLAQGPAGSGKMSLAFILASELSLDVALTTKEPSSRPPPPHTLRVVRDATPHLCRAVPAEGLTLLLCDNEEERFENIDHRIKLGHLQPPEIAAMAEAFQPDSAGTVQKACNEVSLPITPACLRQLLCADMLASDPSPLDADRVRAAVLVDGTKRHQHLYS